MLGSRFFIKEDLQNWIHLLENPLAPIPDYADLVKYADFDLPLNDGRKLLTHQLVGANWLLCRKSALLADEMGLGKTVTSLLAARAIARSIKVQILVIAPASLHSHWRKEADALDVKIDLQSWSLLPKELNSSGTLLIVDEAHYAQNLNTKRTLALLRLSRHPRLLAIWLITGTPIKNGHAKNLYPLLKILNHPFALDKITYAKRFCFNSCFLNKNYEINNSNISLKIDQIRSNLKPYMLHRKKANFLELPPKIEKLHPVSLGPNESKGFNYRLALEIDNYRQRVSAGKVHSDAEMLVILNSLRQISCEFKLPLASRLINQILAKSEPVILFSSFLKPLTFLRNHLGGSLLTGKQSYLQRQEIVNDFQEGKIPLLLTTYASGGFGFTLHRSRNVILLDRPWTPGEVRQAEDRCHRLGMSGTLVSHWIQLGFVDDLIDGYLSDKAALINIFLGSSSLSIERQSLPSMLRLCMQEF